jgi:hypothetical protein
MFKYVKYDEVETEFGKLGFKVKDDKVDVKFTSKPMVVLQGAEVDINDLIASQDSRINCQEITQDEFRELFYGTKQYQRIQDRANELINTKTKSLRQELTEIEMDSWKYIEEECRDVLTPSPKPTNEKRVFVPTLAKEEGIDEVDFAKKFLLLTEKMKQDMADYIAEKNSFKRELLQEYGL